MDERLPRPALLLGLAGLVPFAAGALLALAGPPDWQGPARFALAAYGATILAFLGGVHWGLGLAEGRAVAPRLGLGVVPSLLGWVALLLPQGPGLALLALGILATAAVETAARGLVPDGYLRLRWGLSAGAAAALLLGALA